MNLFLLSLLGAIWGTSFLFHQNHRKRDSTFNTRGRTHGICRFDSLGNHTFEKNTSFRRIAKCGMHLPLLGYSTALFPTH